MTPSAVMAKEQTSAPIVTRSWYGPAGGPLTE
jgi:hypothetical protein